MTGMSLNRNRARQLLAKGDLQSIFIEELGWDRHNSTLEITVTPTPVRLEAVAQKRGMVVYHCPPVGKQLPNYSHRRKIEKQVAKATHEHLIVFTDSGSGTQVWQWVKREPGKPAACREHVYHQSQPGDALLQKLEAIAFTLDEEEKLSLTDITQRTRAGFDFERVTKRFYDQFQKEHTAFLKFVSGITDRADQELYASVMLNRLMFIYFIQRKGFLDGDRDYLRNRLSQMRSEHGKDQFYSFYRYFLLRLFHEALGNKERSADLERLVGHIPYLNGGLFDVHELERPDRYGTGIQIPDQAFERTFDYFDQYQWHLDERPLRADNEINPDVLGYIFEKYINQKQMGAYYTKEDITEYISKNTVLPFLFDDARSTCKVAFENPKGPTVWDFLRNDPNRYVYPAVRYGSDSSLPEEIAVGLNPQTLQEPVGDGLPKTLRLRKGWNKAATSEFGLPGETWREVAARREHYTKIKAKLASGEVSSINDLLTLNLDIQQFAQDVIENCEGPELLRAFWNAIEQITVLDPTCGSGAFLFAAVNILEPLYEACLDRMEAFVQDAERSGEKDRHEKFTDFRQVLERVAAHPNRRYFVYKCIILQNLFGVDIMEEAVEICKLRLFLKLAAQVDPDESKDNLGIEPLPDLDFNIRAGNTLVGFASYDEVRHAATSKFDFEDTMEKVAQKARELQEAFDTFRTRQVEGDGSVPIKSKQELRRRFKALEDELNRYLASECNFAPSRKDAYARWLKSYQPFHWFVEFYRIMSSGGFDVIIGNPPYVEYGKVRSQYQVKGYETSERANLYAFTWERSLSLANSDARLGLIIPVASVSTERYGTLRSDWLAKGDLVISNFNDRPGKLFEELEHIRLAIVLLTKCESSSHSVHISKYNRWLTQSRANLFESLQFTNATAAMRDGIFPKIGSAVEASILGKVYSSPRTLQYIVSKNGKSHLFYTRKLSAFVQILDFVPSITDAHGHKREPSELKRIVVSTEEQRNICLCVLNSSLFYWLLTVWSDCRNLNKREILGFPLDIEAMDGNLRGALDGLAQTLMNDFNKHSRILRMSYLKWGAMDIQCIYPKASKSIIDTIDRLLGTHYGFTQEELDFIINYDIKYRMGVDTEGDEN